MTVKNKYYVIFLGMLMIFSSCQNPDNTSLGNSYEVDELYLDDNCAVYSIRFTAASELLFKLSTSGDCRLVTQDSIIQSYGVAFEHYRSNDSKDLIGKIILFELPKHIVFDLATIRDKTEEILALSVEILSQELIGEFRQIKIVINALKV